MLTGLLFFLIFLLIPVGILTIATDERSSNGQFLTWGLSLGAWFMLALVIIGVSLFGPTTPDYEKNIGKDMSTVYGFKKQSGVTYLQFEYHGKTYQLNVPLEEPK